MLLYEHGPFARWLPKSLVLVLTGVILSGCIIAVDGDPDRGDLALYYTFGGVTCRDAGVDLIEVTLDGEHTGYYLETETFCQKDPIAVEIHNLPDDDYRARIRGYNTLGDLLYDAAAVSVRVFGNTEQGYDIDVPFAPGELTIIWTFAGSELCGDVFEVRVLLVDPFGSIYDDYLYPCDYGGVIYDEVPAGSWLVTLSGIDAEGRILYRAQDEPLWVDAYGQASYPVDLEPY